MFLGDDLLLDVFYVVSFDIFFYQGSDLPVLLQNPQPVDFSDAVTLTQSFGLVCEDDSDIESTVVGTN